MHTRLSEDSGAQLAALQLFLAILRKARVTPPPVALPQTPAQRLAGRYRRYRVEERGLSHWAVDHYGLHIERFVGHQFGVGAAPPARIRAGDVIEYVQRNVRTHTPQQTRNVVTALRSFLRFLHYRGLIRTDLAAAVPAVAHWRMTGLPKHLSAQAVRQVLDRCDQTTPIGPRDYAILLLRHQDPNTTALYAKVDLDALRRLAVAWPGGGR